MGLSVKLGNMNFCTYGLQVMPEVERKCGVRIAYECVKTGYLVRGCRHFKPMKCAGGLMCDNECHWFRSGQCYCRRARQEAKDRAEKIIGEQLGTGKGLREWD